MVRETTQGETLREIFGKEERYHVVIGTRFNRGTPGVTRDFVGSDGTRGTGAVFSVQNIMNPLDVQRVEAGDFLTSYVQTEFRGFRCGVGEQSIIVCLDITDAFGFDPQIRK